MYPVAGVGNFNESAVAYRQKARIGFRHREKTLESPEKKRRAGNLTKQLDGILEVVTKWRYGASEIVEFPHQRAIGIPIGAMQREMPGDFVGETGIGFFHAGHGGFKIQITFGT